MSLSQSPVVYVRHLLSLNIELEVLDTDQTESSARESQIGSSLYQYIQVIKWLVYGFVKARLE